MQLLAKLQTFKIAFTSIAKADHNQWLHGSYSHTVTTSLLTSSTNMLEYKFLYHCEVHKKHFSWKPVLKSNTFPVQVPFHYNPLKLPY